MAILGVLVVKSDYARKELDTGGLTSTDMATDAELRLRDLDKKPYQNMPGLVVGVIHQRVFLVRGRDLPKPRGG